MIDEVCTGLSRYVLTVHDRAIAGHVADHADYLVIDRLGMQSSTELYSQYTNDIMGQSYSFVH